jgi:putative ABC transport system substrate-binding protein
MVVVGDPVALGLVASLSRPGGNITGNTITVSGTLAGKRLEVLKQVLPNVSRVAVLSNKDNLSNQVDLKATLAAAAGFAINAQPIEVRGHAGFDEAFATMVKGRAEALVVLEDAVFATELTRL